MAVSMVAARVLHCQLQPPREGPNSTESSVPDQVKMGPRSKRYTLRSYASDQRRGGLMKGVITTMMMTRRKRKRRRSFDHQDQISGDDDNDHDRDRLVRVHDHQVGVEPEEELKLAPILENLVESIESSKKGYYCEIITGRLAMILFAATMGMELATGESILKTMDAQAIAEGLIGCLAATTCATFFARSSAARKKYEWRRSTSELNFSIITTLGKGIDIAWRMVAHGKMYVRTTILGGLITHGCMSQI